MGLTVGAIGHLTVAFAATGAPRSEPAAAAPRPSLQVALPPAPPPETPTPAAAPPEPASPPPAAPAPQRPRAQARPARPSPTPPAPAMAGQVVGADSVVADFSVVGGDAPVYAGGVTATGGTSLHAVESEAALAAGDEVGDPDAAPSRARGVGLPAGDWRCEWPDDAQRLAAREQAAVVRVTVESDGRVAGVQVLDDPGHGFGEQARRCARRHRFTPARDGAGRPIRAISPPLRLRFER